MLGNELLRGEKVYLNALTRDDLNITATWNDVETMRFSRPIQVKPGTMEDEIAWYERVKKSGDPLFAIRLLADDTLIGTCRIKSHFKQARHAEIGIGLGQDWRGQGYGSDAMRVVLRYGFWEMNLNRMSLQLTSYNPRALASYLKAGFVEEGRQREMVYRDGVYYDTIHMAILRREWDALNPQPGQPSE